jgi:hypothetical protein
MPSLFISERALIFSSLSFIGFYRPCTKEQRSEIRCSGEGKSQNIVAFDKVAHHALLAP